MKQKVYIKILLFAIVSNISEIKTAPLKQSVNRTGKIFLIECIIKSPTKLYSNTLGI